MSGIRVTWTSNYDRPRRLMQVQIVCAVCRKWAVVRRHTESQSVIVTPTTIEPHGCAWWTRLGPLTRPIVWWRKRRRLPVPGTITYRTKETP